MPKNRSTSFRKPAMTIPLMSSSLSANANSLLSFDYHEHRSDIFRYNEPSIEARCPNRKTASPGERHDCTCVGLSIGEESNDTSDTTSATSRQYLDVRDAPDKYRPRVLVRDGRILFLRHVVIITIVASSSSSSDYSVP